MRLMHDNRQGIMGSNNNIRHLLAFICFLSIAGLICSCDNDSTCPDPLVPGTIRVDDEPSQIEAAWRLSGPRGFSLSGLGEATLSDMATGDYIITWDDLPGWSTPASDTLTLGSYSSIRFTGRYEIESGTIMIDVNPDSLNACWVLTGPRDPLYGCGDDTIRSLPPGDYSVEWRAHHGWVSPEDESRSLAIGDAIGFTGEFQPVLAAIEVEPRPLELQAPWAIYKGNDEIASGMGHATLNLALAGYYRIEWGSTESWAPTDPVPPYVEVPDGGWTRFEMDYVLTGPIHVPTEFLTVAAAFQIAVPGNEVRLEDGVHVVSDVEIPNEVLISGSGGANVTVDGNGDNAFWAINSICTITGISFTNCKCAIDMRGFGALTVADCEFRDNFNSVVYGAAAISAYNVDALVVRDCLFEDNSNSRYGGAIYLAHSTAGEIRDCLFRNNQCARGAAVYTYYTSTLIANCTFVANQAGLGGAVLIGGWLGSESEIHDCEFIGNTASQRGGAINYDGASLNVVSCLFAENGAQKGGAISIDEGGQNLELDGCTFAGNTADVGMGSAIYSFQDRMILDVSHTVIAFGNTTPIDFVVAPGQMCHFACTNIADNSGGDWIVPFDDQLDDDGNMSVDPGFCDLSTGNYELESDSPCLPGNNSCGTLIGVYGMGCNSR